MKFLRLDEGFRLFYGIKHFPELAQLFFNQSVSKLINSHIVHSAVHLHQESLLSGYRQRRFILAGFLGGHDSYSPLFPAFLRDILDVYKCSYAFCRNVEVMRQGVMRR